MGEIVKNNLKKQVGATGVITIDGSLISVLRKIGEVTTTPTPTGYANDVMGVDSSNITHVMGVATANIDKIMGV